ncbi:SGNH/GDSL hydrolase family protein [Scleromatobacter humisilvae]|uniref:SGNH/GDSL hydrolase family protein n=1 Tax=Scleromatobacter humisilvae TaxID=2897159 RepID=A0A9X1YQ86_9BURK|nr:SGNH/GDSL hydrolase family protein [Scleromatobacter humisilvae]MCK9685926.1 SGNH/GDSL hydrolase family protein [Scleromatobacter humisilvae]
MTGAILLAASVVAALGALVVTGVLFVQGRRKPDTTGEYVALGSSFAAGIGLGPRPAGSPIACMRSANGYPSLLARQLGLSLVDMSCSGSSTRHILQGGRAFLGAQIDAVGAATRLVTITSGGNDVGYIGDLFAAAGKAGFIARWRATPALPVDARDFGQVTANLVRIVDEVRRRAPNARVALVGYPTVVPATGPFGALEIADEAAVLSRQVGERLHEATRRAADQAGAIFVDMHAPGVGHDACSAQPWINGASPTSGTPFHPNRAGAQAVADAIAKVLADKAESP